MKNRVLSFAALFGLAQLFVSCEAIGSIFKAGMGFGIFIVIAIVVIIVYVIAKIGKK